MIRFATCVIEDFDMVLLEMDGIYYTTAAVVANCLGVTTENVHWVRSRHQERFTRSVRASSTRAKDELLAWLGQHREQFLIERLRQDMVLYELHEVVLLAFYARSERAADVTESVINFYVERLTMHTVPREEHQAVLNQMVAMEERLQSQLDELKRRQGYDASLFGRGLAAQRGKSGDN